jgi:hypothetical protein
MHSHPDCHSASATSGSGMRHMPSELVGVAGFEPAASSSRSQLAMRTTTASACLTWELPSIGVRWRPLLSVVIVTHLVTRSLDLRSSSDSRERRDCSPSRRSDSRHLIVPEVDHRVESIVNPVTRDDFGCHFPDSPGVVGGGPDDRCCRPVIPGVQEAAGRPHTGPVALFAPFMAFEDILCWLATQRQDQAVINFPALQQVDASGGQSWLPSPSALGLNALARRHPVSACHGQSVSRLD